MFDRPQTGERAVLVHINFTSPAVDEEAFAEFRELAKSAHVNPVACVTGARPKPEPKYLIGEFKALEVLETVTAFQADVVLVDHALSPAQERNLEKLLQCRVLDRTGLILDIFAQRASTHEGRLQVELAQLQHLSTRLVRGWTHLERQKGGIGLRGPGETQLETDRRLIGGRIKQLNKRLEKVRNRRQQSRRARQKAEIPTVSLVGYTNAGKSTLFNRLSDSHVLAEDQLFATLDPTFRRLDLNDGVSVIVADTVGFIRQLPHDLVDAFHSTLEETREASLLLHVIDASREHYREHVEHVNSVLKEIDAQDVPQIQVFNKIDILRDTQPRVERNEQGAVSRIWCSAQSDIGLDLVREAISEFFRSEIVHDWIRLPMMASRIRSMLYSHGQVLRECHEESGDILLEIKIPQRVLNWIQVTENVQLQVERSGNAINYCG